MTKTYDPRQRAAEKEESRREDEARLARGEKVENGFFSCLDLTKSFIRIRKGRTIV